MTQTVYHGSYPAPRTSEESLLFLTVAEATAARIEGSVTCVVTRGLTLPGDGGGGIYIRAASEPSHNGKFQSADGAWWELDPVLGSVRVEEFGWNATDMTSIFQSALSFLARTSPAGYSGYGVGRLLLPKGRIRLDSTINYTSALGLIIEGQGLYNTAIEFENDLDALFNINTYVGVEFRNMSINHIATGTRDTWTNRCFKLTPTSGGARFLMHRITTNNFDRVISDEGPNGNGDTFGSYGCRHDGLNTYLYSRNAQAVIHNFTGLTVTSAAGGTVNAIFDIAGFGHLNVDTANFVFNGPTLKLADEAGEYGDSSVYNFINAKWEWRGTATRLIEANGANIVADITMIGSGISGNEATLAPDTTATIPWAEFGAGNIRARFIGGSYEGLIQITPRTGGNADGDYILFDGLRSAPSVSVLAGSGHAPEVRYKDCKTHRNQSVSKDSGRIMQAAHTEVFANPAGNSDTLSTGAGSAYNFALNGPAVINRVSVVVNSASGASAKTLSVYRDVGLTSKICDVVVTSGTISAVTLFASDLAAPALTPGTVYFSWANPNSNTITGQIILEYVSISAT